MYLYHIIRAASVNLMGIQWFNARKIVLGKPAPATRFWLNGKYLNGKFRDGKFRDRFWACPFFLLDISWYLEFIFPYRTNDRPPSPIEVPLWFRKQTPYWGMMFMMWPPGMIGYYHLVRSNLGLTTLIFIFLVEYIPMCWSYPNFDDGQNPTRIQQDPKNWLVCIGAMSIPKYFFSITLW